MVTKKESAQPKTKKVSATTLKTARSKPARVKRAQPKPTVVSTEAPAKPQIIDEKSMRSISQITGFLSVGVLFNVVALVVQIWATLKAKFVLSAVSFAYIIASLILLAALVWCIRLLNQKRALSVWVFLGFSVISILFSMTFNSYAGKALLSLANFVALFVQALLLFELYRLQRKGVLS